MRQFLISVLEVVEVVLVALGAVYVIRTFLVQPFLVSGASMAHTFESGDYLLIDELSYHFRKPSRGEVVVFHYPNKESTYFIKCIIALPGERVELGSGGVVVFNKEFPNGRTLDEPYLPSGTATNARPGKETVFELGQSQYFVLGDNRSFSFDSRDWGLLTSNEVVGLVRLRLWPATGFTVFAAPAYQN